MSQALALFVSFGLMLGALEALYSATDVVIEAFLDRLEFDDSQMRSGVVALNDQWVIQSCSLRTDRHLRSPDVIATQSMDDSHSSFVTPASLFAQRQLP